MKMSIALSRRYRSNLRKTRGVLRYYNWTQHVDTKIIHQPAATSSLTFFPGRAPAEDREPTYGGLSRSGDVHCQIHSRTHSNDISLIYPAVPEKLEHYYDTIAVLEFTLFCKLVKAAIQRRRNSLFHKFTKTADADFFVVCRNMNGITRLNSVMDEP
jgi:hypothetical protein